MRGWLKELREQKGLTQLLIAIKVNISESYYCLIENGERRPSVETAKSIAAALGFDWTRFFEDIENKTS
jgi:transcriptional regulator with XRE-family HTH domain